MNKRKSLLLLAAILLVALVFGAACEFEIPDTLPDGDENIYDGNYVEVTELVKLQEIKARLVQVIDENMTKDYQCKAIFKQVDKDGDSYENSSISLNGIINFGQKTLSALYSEFVLDHETNNAKKYGMDNFHAEGDVYAFPEAYYYDTTLTGDYKTFYYDGTRLEGKYILPQEAFGSWLGDYAMSWYTLKEVSWFLDLLEENFDNEEAHSLIKLYADGDVKYKFVMPNVDNFGFWFVLNADGSMCAKAVVQSNLWQLVNPSEPSQGGEDATVSQHENYYIQYVDIRPTDKIVTLPQDADQYKKPEHVHEYSSEWSYDEEYHWHAATCGHDDIDGKALHTLENGACSVCGYSNKAADTELTAEQWAKLFTLSEYDGVTVKLSSDTEQARLVACVHNGVIVSGYGETIQDGNWVIGRRWDLDDIEVYTTVLSGVISTGSQMDDYIYNEANDYYVYDKDTYRWEVSGFYYQIKEVRFSEGKTISAHVDVVEGDWHDEYMLEFVYDDKSGDTDTELTAAERWAKMFTVAEYDSATIRFNVYSAPSKDSRIDYRCDLAVQNGSFVSGRTRILDDDGNCIETQEWGEDDIEWYDMFASMIYAFADINDFTYNEGKACYEYNGTSWKLKLPGEGEYIWIKEIYFSDGKPTQLWIDPYINNPNENPELSYIWCIEVLC